LLVEVDYRELMIFEEKGQQKKIRGKTENSRKIFALKKVHDVLDNTKFHIKYI
jgi:hypothetical protein